MQETPNLKLKKPSLTDYVIVGDLNENADKIDTAITTNKENLAAHLAERGSLLDLQTTNKETIVNAINEVFQTGNNVKSDTVDALLSVDDSLLVTKDNSWVDVIGAIGQISTGKKWASGSQVPVNEYITINGLSFKPTIVISRINPAGITHAGFSIYVDKESYFYTVEIDSIVWSGSSGPRAGGTTIYDDGFKVRVSNASEQKWIAIE